MVKGKTTTFIQLDEEEARKVQHHGDAVIKKLQKIHKTAVWNVLVGRSFADRIQRGKQASEEINLDHDENSEFDANNPRTWSEDSLGFVQSLLKAAEFHFDGFVVLFCVKAEENDSVDYDELAWELEKCLVYHMVATRQQLVMNEEGAMSRRGLDPVSRKTKTPGRRRSGFLVYLAYQLLDSVTQDQVAGEALNRCVELSQKKRQLLASLSEARLPPQVDEKVRKQVKEMREFMSRDQLAVVDRVREIREPENLEMLLQLINLVKSGKGAGGMMGLNQYLSFLNKGGGGAGGATEADHSSSLPRSSSRVSNLGSPRTNAKTSSTLPRPTSGRGPGSVASSRKPSNATFSISSRSTTPDTPRKNSSARMAQRRESSLASIPSDESPTRSSTPETLRKEEHKASAGARRAPPQPASRAKAGNAGGTRSRVAASSPRAIPGANGRNGDNNSPRVGSARGRQRGAPPPQAQSRTDSGSRSGTPRGAGSARSSVNGDAYSPRMTPSSSVTGSPRMSSSIGSNGGARSRGGRPPPDPGRMITREDLRRMNRSYPSPAQSGSSSPRGGSAVPSPRGTAASSARAASASAARKKPPAPASYSRTSIPM